MTHFMTARRRRSIPSVHVVQLKIQERLDIDPLRTAELFANFGEQGAQGLIEDTLADLEQSAELLRTAASGNQMKKVGEIAAELGVVAASMGFWSCARIAGDLRECAQSGHTRHIPAIVERLARTLVAAKSTDWRYPEPSG